MPVLERVDDVGCVRFEFRMEFPWGELMVKVKA